MADPRAVANGLVAQMSSGWGGSPRDLDYMRDQIERAVRDAQVEAMSCRALPASVMALVEAVSPIAAELGTIEQIDALRRDDGGARPWPTNRSLTDLEARAFLLALSAVLAEFPELKEDSRG